MLSKRLINSNDAAAGGACTTNTNDYPTTNVAYYKMSSAADEKGTYNGTATNVNFNVQGKFGNAGEFNESSNGRIVLPKLPTLTSDVSVSGWFKLRNTAVTDRLRAFSLNAVSGYGGTFESLYRPSDGQWVIRVGNGTSSDTNVLTHTYQLTQSTWYHICFTRDDSTNITKFYINGLEQDSETVSATATIQSSAISVIGNQPALVAATTWKGSIDQVRIFSSALDSTQVESLYNEVYCVPTIVPTDNFNTVLYTGTGSGSKSVTGVGFQPELVWGKSRNDTISHILFDVVRGENKQLSSNTTGAEVTRASAAYEFDSDGFTVTTAGNLNNAVNYVAWSWKAGGAAVAAGGTNLTNRLVSANPDAGFSIMTYTGNSSNGTISHELTQKPELWIFKNLTNAKPWFTLTNVIDGSVDYAFLNENTGWNNAGQGNSTDTVLTVNNDGGSGFLNANNNNYVAYAWHSVDGYSKIGSYTGTGATGNTIVTGFRPAFVMAKKTATDSGYNHWMMIDNKRSPSGNLDDFLFANLSNAESAQGTNAGVTIQSNGFTPYGGMNNGVEYIFMAFAEEALPTVTRNATNPFGDSSELALYKFEDDATDAEGSYNGTASNVTYASGYIDKAAVFNGSSSLVNLPTSVITQDNFSYSLWINPTVNYTGSIVRYVFAHQASSAGRGITFGYVVDSWKAVAGNGANQRAVTMSNPPLNTWTHIAVTYSTTNGLELFVNGVSQGTDTYTALDISSHSGCNLGSRGYSAGDYFSGKIDQVRIFNRALDSGEALALYNE